MDETGSQCNRQIIDLFVRVSPRASWLRLNERFVQELPIMNSRFGSMDNANSVQTCTSPYLSPSPVCSVHTRRETVKIFLCSTSNQLIFCAVCPRSMSINYSFSMRCSTKIGNRMKMPFDNNINVINRDVWNSANKNETSETNLIRKDDFTTSSVCSRLLYTIDRWIIRKKSSGVK